MPATKVTLTGGAFQDSEGNVLANGYLEFVLNQDASITGVGNIASGVTVKIQLGSDGNVLVAPAQLIWGNDQMLPVNSYYRVTGYSAAGQRVWGPNNQQVVGSGVNFSLNSWTPNTVFSWTPSTQPLALQVNGTPNGSQIKLNLKNGSNVAITDDGVGGVTIAASAPTVIGTNRLYHQALVNGTNTAWATAWALFTTGTVFGNNAGLTQPTATTPLLLHQDTNIGATQPTYVRETNKEMTIGILNSWLCKCSITPLTNNPVFWAGITDNLPSGTIGVFDTLTPAANFVGFRLFHPETNWKCICQTDATHQTVVDSGVAATTGLHKFSFSVSGSIVQFFIDGVSVGSISTNVPATTTQLGTLIFAYEDSGLLPNITLSFNTFYWDTVI